VGEAIQDVTQRYPALAPHLFNGDGELRPFVNLFLNQDNVKDLHGLETPLKDDDRLMLVPERGLGGEKQIELGHNTLGAVDGFVSSVWEHVDSWGIAGRGMYWRPTLKVHVAPGAEQRYTDLKTLLDGSGIEVNRSESP
jgi:molybdopterin converting factor small subunit